jgi:hypothetical protein
MIVTTGGRGLSGSRIFVGFGIEEAFFHVGFGDALDRVAEFGGDQFGRVGIDDVACRLPSRPASSGT